MNPKNSKIKILSPITSKKQTKPENQSPIQPQIPPNQPKQPIKISLPIAKAYQQSQSLLSIPQYLIKNATKQTVKKTLQTIYDNNYKQVEIKSIPIQPIRLPQCTVFEHIYDLNQKKTFKCQCLAKQVDVKNAYFDWRFANLSKNIQKDYKHTYKFIKNNGVLILINLQNNKVNTENDWMEDDWNEQNIDSVGCRIENNIETNLQKYFKNKDLNKQKITTIIKQKKNLYTELLKQNELKNCISTIPNNINNIENAQKPGTFLVQVFKNKAYFAVIIEGEGRSSSLSLHNIKQFDVNSYQNYHWFMDSNNRIYCLGNELLFLQKFEYDSTKQNYIMSKHFWKDDNGILDQSLPTNSAIAYDANRDLLTIASLKQKTILEIQGLQGLREINKIKIPQNQYLHIKAVSVSNQLLSPFYYLACNKFGTITIFRNAGKSVLLANQVIPPNDFQKSVLFTVKKSDKTYICLLVFDKNNQKVYVYTILGTNLMNLKIQKFEFFDNLSYLFQHNKYPRVSHASGIAGDSATRLLVKGRNIEMLVFYFEKDTLKDTLKMRRITP